MENGKLKIMVSALRTIKKLCPKDIPKLSTFNFQFLICCRAAQHFGGAIIE
jgi:hypothetical protein